MASTIQRPWTATDVAGFVSESDEHGRRWLTAVAEKGWAVGAVDMEHVGIAGGSDAEIGL